MIRLKEKEELAAQPRSSASYVALRPLGYKKQALFYAPKYTRLQEKWATQPDLRTTLYWNPEIERSGRFIFYTGDRVTPLDVTVEGVTESGQPLFRRYVVEIDPAATRNR